MRDTDESAGMDRSGLDCTDGAASGAEEEASTRSTAHDQPMMPPTYATRTRARPAYWR